MKKIIFVAMVIATPFLGAAEWNFNDPSKLASGEVVVPGVSKFTASNNNLTTSNVVIGGGGAQLGQVLQIAMPADKFLAVNNLKAEDYRTNLDVVDGKIDVGGTEYAKSIGVDSISITFGGALVKKLVVHEYSGVGAYIGIKKQPIHKLSAGEYCRIAQTGYVVSNEPFNSLYTYSRVDGVYEEGGFCYLSVHGTYYVPGSQSLSTVAGPTGVIVDVYGPSVTPAGSQGGFAIRVN